MSWEDKVRRVEPYVPGEQPNRANMIKLNTNENPYPPTSNLAKVGNDFEWDKLRLYPPTDADQLAKEIAHYYHLGKEEVFVGVGSDDVLAMAFMTFFQSKTPILFPDITYSFYDVWANLFQIPYKQIPLTEEFDIQKEDYLVDNGGIIFPNPNAPTGKLETLEMIEEIVKLNSEVVVIVDEAYIDFGGESALPLIHKYDNLLVVQTFSKSRSMAGLRIGYAMGNKKLIAYMNDVKFSFNSYTMNWPAQIYGIEAIRDDDYFKETIHKIITTRERIKIELKELGFHFADSKANFIFATHESYSAKELYEALREKDIFVRYFKKPRIDNYLRITIGTDEEMDILVRFLKEYMKK